MDHSNQCYTYQEFVPLILVLMRLVMILALFFALLEQLPL